MDDQNKKGAVKTILITSIAVAIVLIIGATMYVWQVTGRNPIQQLSDIFVGNPESDGGSDGGDFGSSSSGGSSSSSSSGSSGSSGGGGDGGGSSSSGGVPLCTMRQIAHSLINREEINTCNTEENGICISKTTNCSIEIHNNDADMEGTFSLSLNFLNESGYNLKSAFKELMLGPSEKGTFQEAYNIESTGINGSANQEIRCFFNTLDIPEKEVCF
ncbi:MAG: hypothetical protein KKB31_02835 [Nanoarchaeota archaeon]|nr:hypothetical protein [Nanoarchaeota archaeon]